MLQSFVYPTGLTEAKVTALLRETCVCTASQCPQPEIALSVWQFILLLIIVVGPIFLLGCGVGVVTALFRETVLNLIVRTPSQPRLELGAPGRGGAATPASLR